MLKDVLEKNDDLYKIKDSKKLYYPNSKEIIKLFQLNMKTYLIKQKNLKK